jgi:hypothetical protein
MHTRRVLPIHISAIPLKSLMCGSDMVYIWVLLFVLRFSTLFHSEIHSTEVIIYEKAPSSWAATSRSTVTGTEKGCWGDTFVVASLHCLTGCYACYTNWHFPPFVSLSLHDREIKSNTLYFSIKPCILLPPSLFLTTEGSKDIPLQRWGSSQPGEPKSAPIVGHAFYHVLKPSCYTTH